MRLFRVLATVSLIALTLLVYERHQTSGQSLFDDAKNVAGEIGSGAQDAASSPEAAAAKDAVVTSGSFAATATCTQKTPGAKARCQLAKVPTHAEHPMTGYSRSKFPHWRDPDGNGCDGREDTLLRDGKNVKVGDGCKVLSGTWVDPYGGKTYTVPSSLDTDHIIPLAAAWRRGADGWTTQQRELYANDPLNLLAVSASLNRQKGDKTAEAWKPPLKSYWCKYAERMTSIHVKYRMFATSAEKTALTSMLKPCR